MAQVKVSGGFTRRWKGKLCSEKQYEKYMRMSALGTARKLPAISPEPPEPDPATPRRRALTPAPTHPEEENIAPSVEPVPNFARGRRIVEIPVLAKYLWCGQCKECLSLENIIGESRRGLGSVFNVRCHKCCLINQVPTGKLHPDAAGRLTCFDVNAKAVLGTVDSGCAFKQVAQLFATMNMPGMDFKTFKKYEERIGPHLEAVAKDSCREAAEKERALARKNVEALQKMLSDNLSPDFIIPEAQNRPAPVPSPTTPSRANSPGQDLEPDEETVFGVGVDSSEIVKNDRVITSEDTQFHPGSVSDLS